MRNEVATAEKLALLKVTIRCLPLEQTGTSVITGKSATTDAILAKSY